MDCTYLQTEIGTLEIKGDALGISSILFVDTTSESVSEVVPNSLQKIVKELTEYLKGNLTQFTAQLNPEGTDFQKKVWKQLAQIPFGKTKNYQQIATLLGDPKVIRAAASANGKNPISIVVPCHRVIGSNGSLTGYSGGLHRKKWLLELESSAKQQSLF